ncbi:MAG TPA: hypothetical protein EYP59_10955 [Thiotrichaceae bacterium]|nr:hypothetical protein [Thiotrichaceae bacterium]
MNTLQRPFHFLKLISLFTLLAFLISGCFAPALVADRSGCQLLSQKLELVHFEEGTQVLMHISASDCDNAECLLFILIGLPVISATSFIVSGSIVVIGNTLHWIEKQGKCQESSTQRSIDRMINSMKALGGKAIQSSTELMNWFKQQ